MTYEEKFIKFRDEETADLVLKLPHALGFDFTKGKYWGKSSHNEDIIITKENNSISKDILFEHMVRDQIYSFPLYEHAKSLMIDIKTENQSITIKTKDIVDKVTEYLGTNCFIEGTSGSTDYHIWYKFQNYIPTNAIKKFEKYLANTYRYTIEIRYQSDKIMFPFSKQYIYKGYYDPNKDNRINGRPLKENLKYLIESEPIKTPNVILKLGNFGKKIKCHYGNKTKSIKSDLSKYNNFSYGCGTRYVTQPKIACLCLHLGYDYEDFVKECHYWNDGTSKDMNLSEDSIEKILTGIWEWAVKTHIENPYKKDEPPETFLIDEDFKLSKKLTHQIQTICDFNYIKKSIGKVNGKFQKQFNTDCVNIMTGLLGMQHYRTVRKADYKEDIHKPLLLGVPVGQDLFKKIAKYYGIKNIKKRIDFLISSNLLYKIKNKLGYYYSYKGTTHVNHYYINNIRIIYKKIINKIHKFIKFNNINININKISNNKRNSIFLFLLNNVSNFFKSDNMNLIDLGGISLKERLYRTRIYKKQL